MCASLMMMMGLLIPAMVAIHGWDDKPVAKPAA
jgi:hypothetical protein